MQSGNSTTEPHPLNTLFPNNTYIPRLIHFILITLIPFALIEWTLICQMEAANAGPLLCQDISPRAEFKVAVTPGQKASKNQQLKFAITISFLTYFSPMASHCCLSML